MTQPSASAKPPAPGSLRAWLLACRPKTLPVAAIPVAIGTACAYREGQAQPLAALAALLGALFIQIGTNLANDVFDYEKGADREDRLGPMRVTQAGLLTPRQVRRGLVASFLLATLCGVYLVAVAGWPVVLIGLASIAAGIAYTGGPFPLGYNGLGDVFVMVFFGFVAVAGTMFVQTGHVSTSAWLGAVPVGALATNILVVNNLRDRETDRRAGKRTLIVRWGRGFGLGEYVLMLALSYGAPLCLWAMGLLPHAPLVLLSLPLAVKALLAVRDRDGAALNPSLGQAAGVLVVHGLLLTAAVALSRGT